MPRDENEQIIREAVTLAEAELRCALMDRTRPWDQLHAAAAGVEKALGEEEGEEEREEAITVS